MTEFVPECYDKFQVKAGSHYAAILLWPAIGGRQSYNLPIFCRSLRRSSTLWIRSD